MSGRCGQCYWLLLSRDGREERAEGVGNAVASMPPVSSSVLLHGAQVSSQPALWRSGTPSIYIAVLWIRIRSDLHHFAGSGSASRACQSKSITIHIFVELSKFKIVPSVILYWEITVKIAKLVFIRTMNTRYSDIQYSFSVIVIVSLL